MRVPNSHDLPAVQPMYGKLRKHLTSISLVRPLAAHSMSKQATLGTGADKFDDSTATLLFKVGAIRQC